MHTIKPLDVNSIKRAALETGAVFTLEEHNIIGGLGSAVAEVLAKHFPVPMEFVAIQDTYAESGAPDALLEKYGLTARHVVAAARRVLARKR